MGNKEILNAIITSTGLGKDDHGILTCWITVEGAGWSCGYGGYALDNYNKELDKRIASPTAMLCITEILDTLEVDTWEKLKGQYVRVETSGWGGKITKIGHLMKDKWFSFEEFFKKYEKNHI